VVAKAAPTETARRIDDVSLIAAAAEGAAVRLEALAGRDAGTDGATVLTVQAMLLRDSTLMAEIEQQMAAGMDGVAAVLAVAESQASALESLDDVYLSERGADMRELGRLIVAELRGSSLSRLSGLVEPSVVIAHELTPADTLAVDRELLLALVTEIGGVTSHAAIVARELGVPAVVGVAGATAAAVAHASARVDGTVGTIELLDEYQPAFAASAPAPVALDRVPIPLLGNAGSLGTVQAAIARGAAGIGLFRTEFLFLERAHPPGLEEQVEIYRQVCEAASPHPVVMRTLDSGSDKALPYLAAETEPNPALGRRGVRLWLHHPEICQPQVAALVEVAATCSNLQVMVPMVGARDEMLASRRLFEEEAHRRGSSVPPLGMMVEVPVVTVALHAFADLIDFISIGTNDLAQYALAADRELGWGAGLSELNPGVLGLISMALSRAAAAGINAGVCGELAGRPEGAVFLVGAGATSLSMGAGSLSAVAERLGALDVETCAAAAQQALAAVDSAGALAVLEGAGR
jgi:phosphotransferase system enzyme I (PtsI)